MILLADEEEATDGADGTINRTPLCFHCELEFAHSAAVLERYLLMRSEASTPFGR